MILYPQIKKKRSRVKFHKFGYSKSEEMFNFDSSDEDPDLDELDNPPFETTIIEEDQNFLNFYDFIKLNKKNK
jgi:hypothetical protein